MTSRQHEELVREHFRRKGYVVETTPDCAGLHVSMFAKKEKVRLVIQCINFTSPRGEINRRMIMELYGAKEYFGCQRAIIATDRMLSPAAAAVAVKLKVDIFLTKGLSKSIPKILTTVVDTSFEGIWEKYITPLPGKTIMRQGYKTAKILRVDESGVDRLVSPGKTVKIESEVLRKVVNQLLTDGLVTRDEITAAYSADVSNDVILILSRVSFFTLTKKPVGLKYTRLNRLQRNSKNKSLKQTGTFGLMDHEIE
ncbi:MAG TPA: restriction endonuclease [Paludibacteraceae bacterium]|nr:restriction endonuclease [Bacteroidales bacterium]HPS10842.1 restriction endonuclease [Paludibacteraceae bacterium]